MGLPPHFADRHSEVLGYRGLGPSPFRPPLLRVPTRAAGRSHSPARRPRSWGWVVDQDLGSGRSLFSPSPCDLSRGPTPSGPCSCPLPPPPSWPWVPSRQKSGSSGCSSGPGGRRGQVGSNALPVSPPSSQMDSSLEASVEIFPFSQGMLQTRRGRVTPTSPPEVFLLESTPPQAQPLGLPSHSAPP